MNISATGVTCHAWNRAGDSLVLCPNSSQLLVYQYDGDSNNLNFQSTLPSEHEHTVSSVDWSSAHGYIVSCSHDKTAYVWRREGDTKWRPERVLLNFDFSALFVRWSIRDSFAITSSDHSLAICSFEQSLQCWVSRPIRKKFSSSVACCSFHPSVAHWLLAGSTDRTCKLINVNMQEMEGIPFGHVLWESGVMRGWVNAVAWTPSGELLAVATHDARLHFYSCAAVAAGAEVHSVICLSLALLPLTALAFVSDVQLAAGGFDGRVYMFQQAPGGRRKKKTRGVAADAWRLADSPEDSTGHASPIKTLCVSGPAALVSTVALDGAIIFHTTTTASVAADH